MHTHTVLNNPILKSMSVLFLGLLFFLGCSSRPEVVEVQDNPTSGYLLFELSPSMVSMASAQAQRYINQVVYWNRVDFSFDGEVVGLSSDAQLAGFRAYETTMINTQGSSYAMVLFEDVIVQDFPFPFWVTPKSFTLPIPADTSNPLSSTIEEAVRLSGFSIGSARITAIDTDTMRITVDLVNEI